MRVRQVSSLACAHDQKDLPDMLTFDIKRLTNFHFIAAGKFVQHCIIILRVIARYM